MLLNLGAISFDSCGAVKDEPMVYSADNDFAYRNGGPITRKILDVLEAEVLSSEEAANLVIDTRVHMLKPGWFPSIPGWHCDAIPRDSNKIPDLRHPQIEKIRHFLVVVDDNTGSLTEFLVGGAPKNLPDKVEGENLWGAHSRLIKESNPETLQIKSETLYMFDAREYHNTTPAVGHGWRFFFRASMNTITRGPFNEVRKQVQTYLPYEDLGW